MVAESSSAKCPNYNLDLLTGADEKSPGGISPGKARQALTNTLAQECKIRDVGAEASVVSLDLWIQGDHTGTQGQTQT